jgi:hypothetical protein
MTMPSTYFADSGCPEVRAPSFSTFINHAHVGRREAGLERSKLDVIIVWVLLGAVLAGIYIALAYMIEKALNAIALWAGFV